MRNRKIQRMVKRGEITHEEGQAMAAARREEALSYRNSEGYADPTAYWAMKNVLQTTK